MGRRTHRQPWTVYPSREGVAYINCCVAGKRHRVSLGVPYPEDPSARSASHERLAQEAAAKRYAELSAGRGVVRSGARVTSEHTLHELLCLWLTEVRKLYKGWKTVGVYARTFEREAEKACAKKTPLEWLASDQGVRAFAISRLDGAVRDTVNKEVSRLFGFFEWAVANHHLSELPVRPKLPKGAVGTRTGTQRATPVNVSHTEALDIINAMPEWSAKGGTARRGAETKAAFRVRDAVRFSYETGLRPGTVGQLTKRHWSPSNPAWLRITADIDKIRNEREVPLSAMAQEILARCAPEGDGPIFGVHDLRNHFKSAALQVLPVDKAKHFARYDLRHGRARRLLDASGDQRGTAHNLGWKRITTVNRYIATDKDAGARAVAAADALDSVSVSSEHADGEVITVSGSETLSCDSEAVRRRGLEPLRFYPLAPQSRENQGSRALIARELIQATPEKLGQSQCTSDEPSAFRQRTEASLRALEFSSALWDAFDAFALSEGEGVE